MENEINNLRALLVGGDGAPDFAPNGLLALKKLSIEKFARASNVTRTAIYNYLNNVNRPTDLVLRKMSEVLDIPFALILEYCTPGPYGRPRQKRAVDLDHKDIGSCR